MTLGTELIVRVFLDDLVQKLKANIKKVSGASAESIAWRFDGKRAQVYSSFAWITVLEDGRPPGKWPPKKAIRSWIDVLGIQSDLPKDSLAYLIQKSIGEKGTLLWQRGGNSGMLSDYLNDEYIREYLISPLREKLLNSIVETLLR